MTIALDADHQDFATSVARFARQAAPREALRDALGRYRAGGRPAFWDGLAGQGALTAHLPDEYDGVDDPLVVVAALEAGAYEMLPGPVLPTVATSGVLARYPDSEGARFGLERLAEGAVGACATQLGSLTTTVDGDRWSVSGEVTGVLGAPGVDVLLLGATDGDDEVWFVLQADEVTVEATDGVDLTRSIGTVRIEDLHLPLDRIVHTLQLTKVRNVVAAYAAAEAVGVAHWCHHEAVEYLKVREQFGVKIGTFQGLKHKAARLLTRLEVMTAAAWDAGRALTGDDDRQLALAAAEAALVCLPGAVDMGLACLQLFGGIGFTWEHDLHFYWRRAQSLQRILGPSHSWAAELGRRTRAGQMRSFEVGNEHDDPAFRADVAAKLASVKDLDDAGQQRALADMGLVSPHYPAPYGIGASPAQQLIYSRELQRLGMKTPTTVVGEWTLPSLIAEGTDAQKERFITPTLRGDIFWCQLYSEPGAGSDLAGLSTRATRTEGGWLLNGQKVWNSMASEADWGICLARTDPAAPKHKGITYFLVDMRSDGVDVRPLYQVDHTAEFSEVFLSDVFVPDDCVVGAVNDGWRLVRGALSTERMSIATGLVTKGAVDIVDLANCGRLMVDEATIDAGVGHLQAETTAVAAWSFRVMLQTLAGEGPGAGASMLKLAQTAARVEQLKTFNDWFGPAAAAGDPDAEWVTRNYLRLPAQLIGGGTEEIQLNIVADWVLGLPRR